jgi:hypothetical protein
MLAAVQAEPREECAQQDWIDAKDTKGTAKDTKDTKDTKGPRDKEKA